MDVQIADDVDWIAVTSDPIQGLRQVVEECRRDGLRAQSVDHDDDGRGRPGHDPSTQQLERGRVDSAECDHRQTDSWNGYNRHAAVVGRQCR